MPDEAVESPPVTHEILHLHVPEDDAVAGKAHRIVQNIAHLREVDGQSGIAAHHRPVHKQLLRLPVNPDAAAPIPVEVGERLPDHRVEDDERLVVEVKGDVDIVLLRGVITRGHHLLPVVFDDFHPAVDPPRVAVPRTLEGDGADILVAEGKPLKPEVRVQPARPVKIGHREVPVDHPLHSQGSLQVVLEVPQVNVPQVKGDGFVLIGRKGPVEGDLLRPVPEGKPLHRQVLPVKDDLRRRQLPYRVGNDDLRGLQPHGNHRPGQRVTRREPHIPRNLPAVGEVVPVVPDNARADQIFRRIGQQRQVV